MWLRPFGIKRGLGQDNLLAVIAVRLGALALVLIARAQEEGKTKSVKSSCGRESSEYFYHFSGVYRKCKKQWLFSEDSWLASKLFI